MLAVVLVDTEIGRTLAVSRGVKAIQSAHGTIEEVLTVMGPYDVIVKVTAVDADLIGKLITEEIAKIDGVKRTTTCLSTDLEPHTNGATPATSRLSAV